MIERDGLDDVEIPAARGDRETCAMRVSIVCSDSYSTLMTDKLAALLERLKARQRDLILEAAEIDALPAHSTIWQIAEFENAIATVEAVAEKETGRACRA